MNRNNWRSPGGGSINGTCTGLPASGLGSVVRLPARGLSGAGARRPGHRCRGSTDLYRFPSPPSWLSYRAARRCVKRRHFRADIVPVLRHVLCHVQQLRTDQITDFARYAQGQQHDQHYRRGAAKFQALNARHRGVSTKLRVKASASGIKIFTGEVQDENHRGQDDERPAAGTDSSGICDGLSNR